MFSPAAFQQCQKRLQGPEICAHFCRFIRSARARNSASMVETVFEGLEVAVASIDSLVIPLAFGRDHYGLVLLDILDRLSQCLETPN